MQLGLPKIPEWVINTAAFFLFIGLWTTSFMLGRLIGYILAHLHWS